MPITNIMPADRLRGEHARRTGDTAPGVIALVAVSAARRCGRKACNTP
jgi:hypothetical protein